jgi:signal peptidase II
MQWAPFDSRIVGAALVVLALDETLKTIARHVLTTCSVWDLPACDRLDLGGSVWLVHTGNFGSALGFGQGLWIWVLLALSGLLLIPVYAHWLGRSRLAQIAVGLQLGGALGNIADRVLFGGATDVLFLGRGPVWNLADVALVVGTLLATAALAKSRRGASAQHRRVGLTLDQGVVHPAPRHELGVFATLHKSSVVHDQDQIRVGNRAQPMRDDDGGATLQFL